MNRVDNKLTKELPNFTFVQVQFFPYDGKIYTYKTDLLLKNGDLVVVQDPNGDFKVVKVFRLMSDANNFIQYKWIVSKLELSDFKRVKEVEKHLCNTVGPDDEVKERL
ncbi:hypothetical protein [Caudoviricetes sp.]|nr:hypothetical protein [Caudoviricetes sp.]